MNESVKTIAFVAAAAVIVAATVFSRPRVETGGEAKFQPGAALFPGFTDPLKVTSFEITEFDEDQAAIKAPFKAAVVDGLWSIPSHQNYPADANRQLAVATASLSDLQGLAIVSTVKGEHETYGVIDPSDTKNLSVGTKGVGKHVTLTDAGGNKLVDLIIGKEDPKQSGIRFVRLPGRDEVYATKIDVSKLTTKFHEWIETDLLKLNAFDIKQLAINDYEIITINDRGRARKALQPKGEIKTSYDSKDSKWTLDELKEPGKQGLEVVKLGADQELDNSKLNDLKNALDDLKIVDVERKPEGLAADLAVSDKLGADEEKLINLAQRGFMPAQIATPGGEPRFELFSNNGEVICSMNDGVEYVLRFGQLTGTKSEADDKDKKEGEEKNEGVDRYIMVSARFNQDLIPKPELKPIPGVPQPQPATPATTTPAQPPKVEENKPEVKKEEPAKPAAPAKTEPPKQEESKKQEPTKTESKPAETKPAEKKDGGSGAFNVFDDPAKEAEKKTDAQAPPAKTEPAKEAPKAEPAKTEPKPDTPKAEPAKPADAKPVENKPADAKPAEPKPEDDAKKLEEERKKIEAENKRLQDEYDTKVANGKKRVDELNRRFATWYYIISDSVYRKIHLGTKDVIKKKEGAPATEAKDAPKNDPIGKFNELKDKGLDN